MCIHTTTTRHIFILCASLQTRVCGQEYREEKNNRLLLKLMNRRGNFYLYVRMNKNEMADDLVLIIMWPGPD